MEMNKIKVLDVCEAYIHQVWCMEQLREDGIFAVYSLEQHRIKIHNELCELLEIDHEKTQTITSYLDEKIGLNFSEMPGKSDLRNYAEKLLNILLEEKRKGNLS